MKSLSEPNQMRAASGETPVLPTPTFDAPPAPSKKGHGEIWIAVLCIGLSNLLSACWLWSLISHH